jgi:hypothetical protein
MTDRERENKEREKTKNRGRGRSSLSSLPLTDLSSLFFFRNNNNNNKQSGVFVPEKSNIWRDCVDGYYDWVKEHIAEVRERE